MYDNTSRIIEVDINEILPNRFQPRIQFDEEEILELSDSIKEHGVIQPIVVRTIGDKYEIIAGERRYKASVLAGRETVPVIVKNLNDKDSAEIALIENIQRKNLTPIEEALSYKKILDMGYITQENLASKLGKSQPSVANKIRLLNLSDEVQEALLENKISERHARSLLKLDTSKQQNEMLNRIINERLTVRKTDQEIEKLKNNTTDEGTSDEQKVIEKGEIDMNNNMFGIPNIPQNQPSTSTFNIFGATNQQPIAPETTPVPTFDIFENSTPVVPEVPATQPTENIFVAPTMPVMESTPVVPEVPATQSTENIFVAPTMPAMESTPVVPEVPATQSTENIFVAPTMPAMESTPVMSEVPATQSTENIFVAPTMPEVPQTAPIIESPVIENNNEMTQQSENLFSFGDNNLNIQEPVEPVQPEPTTVPEFKMPEPIIVTDYSKQYDPVMPITPETIVPTVDFKEVINAIRECSNKIEQYGFRLDVEEYDLANLYQVIFKIEK